MKTDHDEKPSRMVGFSTPTGPKPCWVEEQFDRQAKEDSRVDSDEDFIRQIGGGVFAGLPTPKDWRTR